MKPVLISLFALAYAGAAPMNIEMLDQRSPVELPGKLAINRSNDAGKIVYEFYQKQSGTSINSTQTLIYSGLVNLSLELGDFAKKDDSLFLFKIVGLFDRKLAAQAWVNPRNGKCLFFDAPWLEIQPSDGLKK